MRRTGMTSLIATVLLATPALAEDGVGPGSSAVGEQGQRGPASAARAASPAGPAAPSPDRPASGSDQAGKVPSTGGNDAQTQDALAAFMNKASRLKVTGFVQGRYEWHQDSVNGWNYGAKPTTGNPPGNPGSTARSTFYLRRVRLDTGYSGTNAEVVLQLDAGGDAIALRDAEAAFLDTWTSLHLRVSVGQFKYPFGFEIQQSDLAREMPERSRMIQQFFPGERDRGLKVQGRYQMLRFQVALVNGNGIQDPIFKAGKDSNAWLDLVGRVGVDFDSIAGGVSGYYGGSEIYNPSYNATTNPDTDPTHLKRYARVRLGGDVRGNIAVPKLGNLSLRGEVIYGRDKNKGYGGVPADPCQDRASLGWSLTAAQQLGSLLGVAVRVDSYDPLLQGSLDASACSATPDGKKGTYVTAGKDRIITYGGGLLLYVSPNLKASFIYEHPTEQVSIGNDIFTAQLQAIF